jgi:diguanylate cyclase (GGDEF)-like protein/PAS domain S-box-containing protein
MPSSLPFGRLLDQLPAGVFVLDAAGSAVYANAAAERLLGRGILASVPVGELATTYLAVLAGTDDPYPVERLPIVRALAGEESTVDDLEILTPRGRVPLEVWGAPIRGDDGAVVYALTVFQDISPRRLAEAALADVRREFESAFHCAPGGMAMLGLDEQLLEVNDAFCEFLGFSRDELVGRNARDLVDPADREADAELLADLRAGRTAAYRTEKRYRRATGELVWTLQARSMASDAKGRRLLIDQVENIDERKRNEQELAWRALHDPLTKLPNRHLLTERLDHALERLDRQPGGVGVLYIDLDGFKPINDRLGHAAGDEVLRQAAQRVAGQLRRQDTPARVGGDELVVLCENVTETRQLEALAGRLERALRVPYKLAGDTIAIGASIGIAITDGGDGVGSEGLLARADAAMYAAKRERKRAEV